jgi:hypothetical protein
VDFCSIYGDAVIFYSVYVSVTNRELTRAEKLSIHTY